MELEETARRFTIDGLHGVCSLFVDVRPALSSGLDSDCIEMGEMRWLWKDGLAERLRMLVRV